jgi:anti-sigma regulatory factor (Ser/Thr protein kinase)
VYASARARNLIASLLVERVDPQLAFDLRLVASELVENAVLHGSGTDPIRIEATLFDDVAELEVRNTGSLSLQRLRRGSRRGGRGFEIVSSLATAWSIASGPASTRIRVEIPARALTAT